MKGELVDGSHGRAELSDGFDYVIIGSGAAGATAARVLVDSGASVAVVEEGPALQTADFGDRAWPAFRDLYRDMGAQLARGRGLIRIIQGSCLGGSTVVNSAIVWRMPEAVWRIWETEHGLGEAIPYRELETHWDLIERELGAEATQPEIWGENNRLLDVAANRLGVTAGPTRRYAASCTGSARCPLGCPTGAKQSMLVSYLPYARDRGATILSRARARHVALSGGKAVGVQGDLLTKTTPRNVRGSFQLHARKGVLVAASAIQTPGLLGNSGLRSPHLGEHFQGHPGSVLLGVFDQPVKLWSGATQGYNVYHHVDDPGYKVESLALPVELLLGLLPGVGPDWVREMARSGHIAAWDVALRARAHGSVRRRRLFGGTQIRYDPQPADIANLRRGLRFTAELLFAAGAREVLPGIHGLPERLTEPRQVKLLESGPDDPTSYSLAMSHLFGTARMSVRPRDGVVGTDFAVHGVKGLYVIDSSVFPTNLGVNPQHTIMAVAMHAAQRIGGP